MKNFEKYEDKMKTIIDYHIKNENGLWWKDIDNLTHKPKEITNVVELLNWLYKEYEEPKELFYEGKQLTKNGIYTNPFYKYVIKFADEKCMNYTTYDFFEFADYLVNELKEDYTDKQEEAIKNLLRGD